MKKTLLAILIVILIFAITFLMTGCGDDEIDVKSDVDYDMLGTWYAEKVWSVPTQYDWDGFDTYVLREWHSFEAGGILRVKNSFYLKPSETSYNLVEIQENPWGNEPCEWSIKGKLLTWTYSDKTITKNIVHDSYTDLTSVNGKMIEMTYKKQGN